MKNKILSFVLALCLIIPCALVFTACGNDDPKPTRVASVLTTNIEEQTFLINRSTEFTFTTVANDDKDVMVYGISNFSDEEAITSLQYKAGEVWVDYPRGEAFGPATGFPMSDATSTFRVTFNKTGEYTFTAFMKTVDGDVELCRTEVTFTVGKISSTLSTNIEEKTFTVNESTEFTFTTVANDDANVMVYGISNFSDEEAISSLQYKAGEVWVDYPRGEAFGSVTGFPMSDATSTFRVTFKTAGEYTFTAFMKTVDGDVELCRTEVSFTVNEAA